VGKGALLGGIAGVTGGLAGEAVAGWLGGSAIANGAISGFAGGVVGDSAQQGAALLLGWRPCFSIPEALASGAVGGVLGGAGGWWAESRGSTLPESGWKGGSAGSEGPPPEHIIDPGAKFPHYRPDPLGEGGYTAYRPAEGTGWSASQEYDAEGYAVRRTDYLSRSGRTDHEFPHYHEMEWSPGSRNPAGAPSIGGPIPGLPPGG
jgi:hypothetical protein